MIPVHCRVGHDPENGRYGDCVRACVASILEMVPESIPHFVDGGVDAETANKRMRECLKTLGLQPFFGLYDGSTPLAELLELMRDLNPDVHYILFGRTNDGGNHAVVCKGGAVVHNPAWYGNSIVEALATGFWHVIVIARS